MTTYITPRPYPRSNATDTSRAAADLIAPKVASVRERVLAFVQSTGRLGTTQSELTLATGIPTQSASGRLNDLLRAGVVVDSGERRMGACGAKQRVLVAIEYAEPTEPVQERLL